MADGLTIIPFEFESEESDLPKIRGALNGTVSKDDNVGLLNYRCPTPKVGTSNPDAATDAA